MKAITFLLLIVFMSMTNMIYAQNIDFLFMIEQAIKAPSGHNTQPWLFKVNKTSIEIHPNFDKSLSVVDFDNRELFISLGCAVENLCIAASFRGYESTALIDEDGVITISLTKQDYVRPNPLFEQIAVRQTNRSVYNGNIIPDDTIKVLYAVPIKLGINVHFYKIGTADFDTISNFIFKGNATQMSSRAFKEELKQWMRYNQKHQNETNDGLSYAVFGVPNLPKFIVKPIMLKAVNEKYQNKSDKEKIRSSSHFILFTTQNNTIEEWINLGRNLENFLLKSTEMGIIYAYLNQPNEIRDLSIQMGKALNLYNEYPTILLRVGYGGKMPYSKRKDINKVIINK